ncbi:hypothetical protein KIH39_13025 [Telmatocola sphagniphila]|uniref:Uncharacterized protein n=1 Tax=Telmatocola sphagniphila TaxID=1123043 RepID=A0A8E6BCR1_9BACT|nr:hypothetical protein [Telmatocola sphagniphila]QVL34788.1 hypothetical protein KIH39_13025 [Telmatocola sphagniphila]
MSQGVAFQLLAHLTAVSFLIPLYSEASSSGKMTQRIQANFKNISDEFIRLEW